VTTRPRIRLVSTKLLSVPLWHCACAQFGGFSYSPAKAFEAWQRSREREMPSRIAPPPSQGNWWLDDRGGHT
jgi:hypothetical protein